MYCLRCGSETQEEKVFCAACLENMEQYPVKADAHIHLPKKAPAKRQKTPEDRLAETNRLLGWMSLLLLVAVGLLALAMFQLIHLT